MKKINIYRVIIVFLILINAFQYFNKEHVNKSTTAETVVDVKESASSEKERRKLDDSLTIMRGWNMFCFSGMSVSSYTPSKSDSGITYDIDIKPVQLEYKPMYNKVYRIDNEKITTIDSSFYNFEPITIDEEYKANSIYFGVLWLPWGHSYQEFTYFLWFDNDNYKKRKSDKRMKLIHSFFSRINNDSTLPNELEVKLENETY